MSLMNLHTTHMLISVICAVRQTNIKHTKMEIDTYTPLEQIK